MWANRRRAEQKNKILQEVAARFERQLTGANGLEKRYFFTAP